MARFAACHGILVEPPDIGLDLGWLEERPPRSVTVEVVEVLDRAPDSVLVRELIEPPAFGLPQIVSQMWEEPAGSIWFGNTLNMSLRIQPLDGRVLVATRRNNRQVLLEALASIALPLVAQQKGSLVLHATASCRDGEATLVCGDGGNGKSSLLIGLAAAGWQPMSEDQCIIDSGGGCSLVWPGPSWVRLEREAAVPAVFDNLRFEALDKLAWDIEPRMAHSPARVSRVIFLESPGGDRPVWERIPEGKVIGMLARHTTWLQRPSDFGPTVFPRAVDLARAVPAYRMRLPWNADWLTQGVALLTSRST